MLNSDLLPGMRSLNWIIRGGKINAEHLEKLMIAILIQFIMRQAGTDDDIHS